MANKNILDARDLELLNQGVIELLCTKQTHDDRQRTKLLQLMLGYHTQYAYGARAEMYTCFIEAGDTWRCQVCGGPQQL